MIHSDLHSQGELRMQFCNEKAIEISTEYAKFKRYFKFICQTLCIFHLRGGGGGGCGLVGVVCLIILLRWQLWQSSPKIWERKLGNDNLGKSLEFSPARYLYRRKVPQTETEAEVLAIVYCYSSERQEKELEKEQLLPLARKLSSCGCALNYAARAARAGRRVAWLGARCWYPDDGDRMWQQQQQAGIL